MKVRAAAASIPGTIALAILVATAVAPAPSFGQEDRGSPTVLLVVAHPDDEAMFAATVYKITHALGGDVDLALITDGSGGYRYAQLAEPIYGLDLTDETVARHHLPAIRKRELMAGGTIVGIRNYFFLDEYDHAYTENVDTVLNHVWSSREARSELREIMHRVRYDFVFVHLPVPHFHAHHKAAAILALQAANSLPDGPRPIVLGSFVGVEGAPDEFGADRFTELPGYPITRLRSGAGPFIFDRRQPLSSDGRLDYTIIVNWLIAEHKTQGTMQLLVNTGDVERFWYFEANGPEGIAETRALFQRLAVPVVTLEPGD